LGGLVKFVCTFKFWLKITTPAKTSHGDPQAFLQTSVLTCEIFTAAKILQTRVAQKDETNFMSTVLVIIETIKKKKAIAKHMFPSLLFCGT